MPSPLDRARDLLEFIHASPSPFHAVRTAADALQRAGFRRLSERDPWSLSPGDKCFVTRNASALVAFVVGTEPPSSAGFAMTGAHTDSPCPKVKPNPELFRSGVAQLAVEPYGGMLLSTWLDRDLGMSGRVLVERQGGSVVPLLVSLNRPILRIPNLAIHLDREVNTKGVVINQQQHMVPLIGLDRGEGKRRTLREILATELARQGQEAVKPEAILGFDLVLHDAVPGVIGGLDEELIFSPRIDNLACCHASVVALCESSAARPALPHGRLLALWDHEECGSRSAQGAAGPFLRQVIERVLEARGETGPQACARTLVGSFLVSADMAHAVHPNYADRHEPSHAPLLGKGPVVKTNANQSYASDGLTAAHFARVCRDAGVSLQQFVTRSDLPCGSTIGPVTAALTGVRTIDVGGPMLSMHSCRELAAVDDHASMIDAMTALFAAGPGLESEPG